MGRASALGDSLGGSTEAIRASERDGDPSARRSAMTVIPDIVRTWPDVIVDIGPIQLADHYWATVGSIPYDGHVVLAVSPNPPSWTAPHS
jgi:hypothetical protein